MAEPINLNRARKTKAKADAKAQAAANRVKFGRTGAAKASESLEAARKAAVLDGARKDE